jgi:putative hydrolase of the HAD superfamily
MALVNSYSGFIFDYGGVLAHHQTDADQARLAAIAGIPKPIFTELYWSTRPDYDKGLISGTKYWETIAEHGGGAVTPDTIGALASFDNVSWMHFDDFMWGWIDRLRAAGKRVAMLSNMPRELGEALRTSTDKLNRFDAVTLSYEVHAIKPEPAIYHHCLQHLGTSPEETLFLDDRLANVQGAEAVGIHGIHFTSRDDVLDLLSPSVTRA